MIDEYSPAVETEPATVEQDLPGIVARLDFIDGATTEPLENLYAIIAKQGETYEKTLESAVNEQIKTLNGRQPGNYEVLLLTLDALQEEKDAIVKAELNDQISPLRLLVEEAVALERVAEPRANKEFHETRDQLIASAQWESIIAKGIAGEKYGDLREVLTLCNLRFGSDALDFRQAMSLTEDIQDWLQQFAAQDDLLPQGESQQLPEGWQPTVDLDAAIQGWKQSVRDIRQYLSRSRREFLETTVPTQQFSNLQNLSYGIYLQNDDSQSGHVPQGIAYALERNVEMTIQDFNDKDTAYLHASLQERPNMLFIGNQSLLEETTEIDDVNAWLQQRLRRHPDSLTSGLGFVHFMNGIEDSTVKEDGSVWSTTGLMETNENAIRIDIKKGFVERIMREDPELAADAKRLSRSMIEETIDHELTHYAHKQRLTIAWLQEWHQVTENEKVNVTHYVENMRSDTPTNAGNASQEDLAESTALYLDKPGELLMKAPLRFATLNNRDGRYDTVLSDTLRTTAEREGFTEGTVMMINAILEVDAERAASSAAKTFPIDEV